MIPSYWFCRLNLGPPTIILYPAKKGNPLLRKFFGESFPISNSFFYSLFRTCTHAADLMSHWLAFLEGRGWSRDVLNNRK